MAENLMVRVYKVGFGDCIYLKIPDGDTFFHVLIDCGTSGKGDDILKPVLCNLKTLLRKENADLVLDLLIVTHPHADHIKGFNPEWFEGIKIRNIWLSAFMKEDHPLAQQAIALQQTTENAVISLLNTIEKNQLNINPEANHLLINSISNTGALEALKQGLPGSSEIQPLYVARDIAAQESNALTPEQKRKYKLDYDGGTTRFIGFNENTSKIRVLAPEWDIDRFYLGGDETDFHSLLAFQEDRGIGRSFKGEDKKIVTPPKNISRRDFNLLINSIYYSAFAFILGDKELKNNTSVVLMFEWRGRRLLFTGDAEYHDGEFKENRRNSSWDIMYNINETKELLSTPIDFLKIGHHGSVNGFPFLDKEGEEEKFLNDLLPPEQAEISQAVVSTLKGKHGGVPYPLLMKEIGSRIKNACIYSNHPDEFDYPQPPRTDRETDPWIDIFIESSPNWSGDD
jgi:beta-lactamase superfamily II metal-dependent hydrolase